MSAPEGFVTLIYHNATLTERDATITELRAALSEAAQCIENFKLMCTLEESKQECEDISNTFRTIANSEPK